MSPSSRHRATERVMAPVECLARLASIVARPRYPLLRLHGVFGARHRWRARVVPKPPTAMKSCAEKKDVPCGVRAREEPTRSSASQSETASAAGRGDGRAALALPVQQPLVPASLLAAAGAALVAPNVLSLLHWERIEHGALYATSSRIDWRSLLRRTFQADLRL